MAAKDQRALVIEVATATLDRLETALRHTSAVASKGRPVWLVLSGPAVMIAARGGITSLRRSNGQLYRAAAMRQESLGLPDVETLLQAFNLLPTRLIAVEEDARDYGLKPENTRRHPPVEVLNRAALIEEAQSDAWMVF